MRGATMSITRFAMSVTKFALAALPLALVFGCSPGRNPAVPAHKDTVFDPLVKQEQRARDVQKTLDGYALQQRRAVDAEERGDASR
jgi:hypothetical protein